MEWLFSETILGGNTMAKVKTIRDQIADWLIEQGHVEVQSNSRKYRKFESASRPGVYWWLGKMGGLRYGRTSTGSVSRTSEIIKKLKNG
jgi:hypothetical protein